jgi:hypothetical protein
MSIFTKNIKHLISHTKTAKFYIFVNIDITSVNFSGLGLGYIKHTLVWTIMNKIILNENYNKSC